MIDKGTATDNGYGVGDRIGVAARGPVRQYTITGIARYGTVNSIGGATIAVFDVPTAQALLGKRGQYDTIFVAARKGVSSEQLVRDLRPVVPATAQVKTGQQQANADSKATKDNSKFVQMFLLGFGFIAVGVGAFVIFNTLSITLAQRIRELATLRTLGASRRQIKRSVLTEGLAIGVFASVVGLVLGLALAKGLNGLFQLFGIDLPHASTVIQARTVIVALSLGTIVTLIASLSPARRATRIAPIAAMREGATLPPRLGARRPSVPITILAVAAVLCLAGAFGGGSVGRSMILVGLGSLALFLGVIMIAGRLIRPLVAIVGGPARRFGGPAGRLASGNSTRNTTRTATTAAALMIGLALVTLVATMASGFRASGRSADEKTVKADYVVTSKSGFDTIPAAGRGRRRARSRSHRGVRRPPRRGEGIRSEHQRRRHPAVIRGQRQAALQQRLRRGHPGSRQLRRDRHKGIRGRPPPPGRQRPDRHHLDRPPPHASGSSRSPTRGAT